MQKTKSQGLMPRTFLVLPEVALTAAQGASGMIEDATALRKRFRVRVGSSKMTGCDLRDEGVVGPDSLVALIPMGKVADEIGDVYADLRTVTEGDFALPGDGRGVVADDRGEALVIPGVDVLPEALEIDGDTFASCVGQIFVEGTG